MEGDNELILSSLSVIATERDEALSLLSKISGDMFQLLGSESNSLKILKGCSKLVNILEEFSNKSKHKEGSDGPCGEWAKFLSHIFSIMSGMTNVIKSLEKGGYAFDGTFVECPSPPSYSNHGSIPSSSMNENNIDENEEKKIDKEPIIEEEEEEKVDRKEMDELESKYKIQLSESKESISLLQQELKEVRSALLFIHDESLYNDQSKDENNGQSKTNLFTYQKLLQDNIVDKRRILISESKARNAEAMNIELRKQVDELFSLAYAVEKPIYKNDQANVNENSLVQELKILLDKHEKVIEQQRVDLASLGSLLNHMNLLRKLEVVKVYETASKLREELYDVKQKLEKQQCYSFDLEMELTLHGLNSNQSVPKRDNLSNSQNQKEMYDYEFLNHTNVQVSQLQSKEMLARAIYLHSKRHEWCMEASKNKSKINQILASHPSNLSLSSIKQDDEEAAADMKEDDKGKGQDEKENKEEAHMIDANDSNDNKEEVDEKKEEEAGEKVGATSSGEDVHDSKETLERAEFLNNISRNWNLLGLGAMDEFLNEVYTWDSASGDLIGLFGQVEALEPPPPHSLNSPLVNEVLCQWTGDVSRQQALISWMSLIIDEKRGQSDGGNSNRSSAFPTLQLTKLNRDSLEGFLALVFPLLLRRQDIAVEVSTRERRTTAYDVRVQVTKLSKRKKHMTSTSGMHGNGIQLGESDMKRSSSETSLPQQYGRSYPPKSPSPRVDGDARRDRMMLSPRGIPRKTFERERDFGDSEEESVDEETWKTWHHLALRAAIEGHVEVIHDGVHDDSEK